MRTKLSILVMILVALTVIFTGCDSSGIKAREAELKEKKRLEEEKKLEKKIDILQGNIGELKADPDFAGKTFKCEKIILKFDRDTNSCSFELKLPNNIIRYAFDDMMFAEYTSNGDKIVLDFTKISNLLATITEEECLAWYKKLVYDSALKNGLDPEKNWDTLWAEHEKRFKEMNGGATILEMIQMHQKVCNETFTKYRKYPQVYEGTISADKKHIKIRKLEFASFSLSDIQTFENIELVEK